MSFGFSVGDLITVIELANRIRKHFSEAPAQFKEISDEVRNLSFVMQDVEVDLSSKELSNQQKTELQEIAASCRNILAQIEKSIHNYRELKTEDLMRRHTVKRVWKRLKWEPEDIHNLRQRLSSNIVLLNAFNGQITRRNVAELLQIQNSQERYAILDWLSPEIYTTQQSDQISRHQPGTCQWFLHSNEFQSWIKTPKETLFCPGIPGAGKTILASVVVEELYSQYGNTSAIGIAYISCNFRRHEQQDSRGLLANLLRQLAQGQPSLAQGQPSLTVNVKKLYDQHKNRGTRPSMEELSRALCFVLCHYARTFLVIDALDECQSSDGSRTRILNEIFGLQYEHNLNFLATSRFIPEITALFNDKPSLEIRAVEEDVSIFLRANLAKLPSFVSRSSKLQDEITSTITKAADGMFLLAQLHLNSLTGKKSPKALRSVLANFMTGLESPYDSAYNDAMERVEGQVLDQKEMAKQVLSWISCARRQLTTVELRNALAVELNEPEFDRDNVPDLIDIVSVCAGLVTVDEKSDIIRLVHYTTQEFFQRTWTSWFPDAHWMVARTCVTYLPFDTFKTGSCSTDKDFETRLYQYPLYSYAAANWGFHYQAQPVDVRLAIRFLSDINTLDACVQGLWAKKLSPNHFEYSQRFPKQFAMLHVAACFGLEGVMQQLIQLGHETNVKDSYGRTPLSWAAQDGCDAVVRILLENRADPNSKDKDGLSPLSWAAISGHETVAELLLEKGAHSDMKHEDGRTPLLWTAYRGHERLLQLLLENGADPDSKDKNGLSPLSLAAFSGRKSVVHLLLKNGVDSDSKDVNGRTSLSQAASSGHKEIVQLLLEWGVDLESRDKNGQTALLLAAQKGHEEVVHLLQNQEYDQFPKSKHK